MAIPFPIKWEQQECSRCERLVTTLCLHEGPVLELWVCEACNKELHRAGL